ncbi:Golgi phosphoprotein 3 (GPP34) [Raineyella antarctica]|uniref:Golgi phosphoprotein 3 (GPP34) n=1 Tax=Raineyella antarctica TaxID=1577474 RepID=A0A1G6GGE1_9ACTN|nr:GPP34 family phosphoprotein [Raineyella antarctica]SDB80246.1 Golgi phosphoprotein 3 (GPP34) [Raineyella antarctica]
MLWAENLLLLLTDRRTGRLVVPWNRVDLALAGSVLGQLWRTGRIDVDHPERPRLPGRIHVLDASPTGDEVLDRVLAILATTERRPIPALHRIKAGVRRSLYERLEAEGVLVHRTGRALGFIPLDLWPVRDARSHEPFTRRLVNWWTSPTYREASDDAECASATALLGAIGAVGPVVRRVGPAQQARGVQRTAALAREASWVATAVHQIHTSQQAGAA